MCPRINECIKKQVHVHNRILLGQKNDKVIKFAGKWRDLESNMLSEVSQRENNTNYLSDMEYKET